MLFRPDLPGLSRLLFVPPHFFYNNSAKSSMLCLHVNYKERVPAGLVLNTYIKHDVVQSNAAPAAPAIFEPPKVFLVMNGISEAKRCHPDGCVLATLCRSKIA
jgi:hypothetical protein